MRKLILSITILGLMLCIAGCEKLGALFSEETLLYGNWNATQLSTETGNLFFGNNDYCLRFNEDGSCIFYQNGGDFKGAGEYTYNKEDGRIFMQIHNLNVNCICNISLTCDVRTLTKRNLCFSVTPKKEYEAVNDAAPFVEDELETWYFER